MDDLISRATAIARIDKCVALSGIGLEPVMAVRDIKALISVLPAVNAAPVVRCRDCKHGEPTHNARGEAVIKCEEICWLCRLPRLMEPDWFCADGERRDDDGQTD